MEREESAMLTCRVITSVFEPLKTIEEDINDLTAVLWNGKVDTSQLVCISQVRSMVYGLPSRRGG